MKLKIKKLTIESSEKNKETQIRMFEKEKTSTDVYEFKERVLITSEGEHSRGKTSLVRFLLYALGYPISQTDGMEYYSFRTKLVIEVDKKEYILIRDGNSQFINNTLFDGKIKNRNSLENIPMINNILNIADYNITKSLIGSFYIDQEKGWSLLNRGFVVGKIYFGIEEFLGSLFKVNEFDKILTEKHEIEEEKNKLSFIIKIKEERKEYKEKIVSVNGKNEQYFFIKELEEQKNELDYKIFKKRKEINKNELLLEQNEKFIKAIENMNIVLTVDNKNVIVTRENIKDYDFNKDIIELKINELKLELEVLEKERNKKRKELLKIRSNFSEKETKDEVTNILSELGKIEIDDTIINVMKINNTNKTKINNKKIKDSLDDYVKEFWGIMKPILSDLQVPSEYMKEDTVLKSKLKGLSGMQLHKLTFGYKIALNILVKNKLNIILPFIIDSPRSGEANEEISSLMLNVCFKYLNNNQIIISSVYSDYILDKEIHKIKMEKGVIKSIDKFLKKQSKEC